MPTVLDNFHLVDKTRPGASRRQCLTAIMIGLLAVAMCGVVDSASLPDESPTEQVISPLCPPEIIELHMLKRLLTKIWLPAINILYSAMESIQYTIYGRLSRAIDQIEWAQSISIAIQIIHSTLVKFRNTALDVRSFQLIGDKITALQTSSIMEKRHEIFTQMLTNVNLTITEFEDSSAMRDRKIECSQQEILFEKQAGDFSLMSHIDISILQGLQKFLNSADRILLKLVSPETRKMCWNQCLVNYNNNSD